MPVPLRKHIRQLLELNEESGRATNITVYSLALLIGLNVMAAVLDSVPSIERHLGDHFMRFEIFSVAVFTVEYLARLWAAVELDDPRFRRPVLGRLRYAVTPLAIVDLIAILPLFLSAFITVDLRFMRLLRVLRIFKLGHLLPGMGIFFDVMRAQRRTVEAVLFLLLVGVLFAASGIYFFEHDAQPEAFGSIPEAMWWAIVTLTTVGYGDVTPVTTGGKLFGASMTLLGIGMVAIPAGILASGLGTELERRRNIYRGEVRTALEDGVIDSEEEKRLEALRQRLGLSETDGCEIPMDHAVMRVQLDHCPHCGKSLDEAVS